MGLGRVTRGSTAFLLLVIGAAGHVLHAAQPSASTYTCIDANGKKLIADRPIPECGNREQRELNADGSVKRIVPPTATADERAAAEARERDAIAERVARQDAIRRDRNLLMRFPNEAAHRKARTAALDDARKSVEASEARLAALAKERKPLVDEAEFYAGRQLPIKLKTQIESNDVATEALRALILNQQAEVVRVNQLYDAELERLKKLWAGAQPGSLGALPAPDGPASGATAAVASATASAPAHK
jgi:hypothetical protein